MYFTKTGIIQRKLHDLLALENDYCEPLDVWETRKGYYRGNGEYVNQDEEWEEVKTGYRWECSDNFTRWFRKEIVIPKQVENRQVFLELDFGGEGIVRINGLIASAVTSYLDANMQQRTRVLLCEVAKPGEVFAVEAEMHTNYMEFNKYRQQGQDHITYTFRYAKLICINCEIESYYFDILNAYEAMQVLNNPAEAITKCQTRLPDELVGFFEHIGRDNWMHDKLAEALTESLTAVSFDMGREKMLASIPSATRILRNGLDALPKEARGLVYFVGQAHIDTAWLWPVHESERKTAQTFSNVCALMDRYPDFTFAFSQPQLFEFLKEHYPDLYARVKEFVAQGRIEPVGNTWVEMDTNVPSGESLVRQLLYGSEFFSREFGKTSDVFWMPDVFGYTWALPQIIARSGMKYFFTSKLINNDDHRFPYSLFMWQGIDGTRIPAYLQRLNYNGKLNAETLKLIYDRFDQKTVIEKSFMTFGYGDGGGGPSYQMLEKAKRLSNFPFMPKLRMSTASEYFSQVDTIVDKLPVWNGEMYYEFHRGTYTSQANNKKNNRKCEFILRNAEMISVLAMKACSVPYPYTELLACYKKLLINQFHDILPGSSIHSVYEKTATEYAWLKNTAKTIIDKSAGAIIRSVDRNDDMVIVFNPLSWRRSGLVEIAMPDSFDYNGKAFIDTDGKLIRAAYDSNRRIIRLWAEDVPSMGYSCYRIIDDMQKAAGSVIIDKGRMENRYYAIVLDKNGNFQSIYDKINNREVLAGPGNVLKVFEDKPAAETAWNIDLEYKNKYWEVNDDVDVTAGECNEIYGTVVIRKKFNDSSFVQYVTIYADDPRIDIRTEAVWNENEKMLKAEFPVDVLASRASYEIQFGTIERTTHDNTSYDRTKFEVPAQKWADLSEGKYGVSLLNDCKYGYDIRGNVIRITLLRSSIDPDPTADRGTHTFTYSLYPHSGDWIDANTVMKGYELNAPLSAVMAMGSCEGIMPQRFSAFECLNKNVVIDTVKAAENGEGVIIRMYESSGTKTEARIKLGFATDHVCECNLMEKDEGTVNISDGIIDFVIKPFEIKTLRIQ